MMWTNCSLVCLFPSFFPLSVQDKRKVVDPVAIPRFIPEITIGGSEYDKIYYEYRSVSTAGRGAVVWEPGSHPCSNCLVHTLSACLTHKGKFWILPRFPPFLKSTFPMRNNKANVLCCKLIFFLDL